MKKLRGISAVLVLSLTTSLCSIGMSLTAFASPKDIQGHWAQGSIQNWISRGYISGYPDGSFKPDAPITRAEFVVLVNNAFQYYDKKGIYFSDVPGSHWAYSQIQRGVAGGYIRGDSEGTFRPESPVIRQEAAVMLAQVKKIAVNAYPAESYADAWKIPTWSKGYVGAVSQFSIMKGFPDGTFRPNNTMTRAEAVTALSKAMDTTISGGNSSGNNNGSTVTKQDYTLNSSSLRDKRVTGDLIISSSQTGTMTLENVTVEGDVIVKGGATIEAKGCTFNRVLMDKSNVTLNATQKTKIDEVVFQNDGKIKGTGYDTVTISNTKADDVTIDAEVETVELDTDAKVKLYANADIGYFTATSAADTTSITFTSGAKVDKMELHDKVRIQGKGDIGTMTVYVSGVQSSIRPNTVKTMDGASKPSYTSSSSGSSSSGGSSSNYSNLTIDKDNKKFDGDGDKYNNVTVRATGATVKDMVIYGNLTIDKEVGNGSVTLEDVEVRGEVRVYGGGENSVVFDNCYIKGDIVSDVSDKDVSSSRQDDPVSLKFYKNTTVDGKVRIYGNTILEPYHSNESFYLDRVNVERSLNKALDIETDIGTLNVNKKSEVTVGSDTRIADLNVSSTASNSTVNLRSTNSKVTNLKAYAATSVTGNGYVEKIYAYKDVKLGSSVRNDDIVYGDDVKVTGVTVSPRELTLEKGGTAALTAVISPSNATNKAVTWKSSNELAVRVDANGNVTALIDASKADITVTTKDGSKTAVCTVTVSSGLNTALIDTAVQLAENTMKNVVVSASAADVPKGTNYVTTVQKAALSNAVAKAKAAKSTAITNADVNKAVSDLTAAINLFQSQKNAQVGTKEGIDKSLLNAEIQKAEALYDTEAIVSVDGKDLIPGQKWVTQASKNALNTAMNDAKAVAGKASATQAEVSSATSNLKIAQEQYVIHTVADLENKDKLEADIAAAEALQAETGESADGTGIAAGQYYATKSAKDAYQSAIVEAVEALTEGISQNIIDNAIRKLAFATESFNNARKQAEESIPVNKDALVKAVNDAEENRDSVSKSADGKDIAPTSSWVTEAVYNTYNGQIHSAITIKDNAKATQAEVDMAVANLAQATVEFDNLKKEGTKVETNKTPLQSAINSASDYLNNIKESTNGLDVKPEEYWAVKAAIDAFLVEISKAQGVHDSTSASQVDLDRAKSELESSKNDFQSNSVQQGKQLPPANTTNLAAAISSGQGILNGAPSELNTNEKNALIGAISNAQIVMNASNPTQQAVDDAQMAVVQAVATYQNQIIQYGKTKNLQTQYVANTIGQPYGVSGILVSERAMNVSSMPGMVYYTVYAPGINMRQAKTFVRWYDGQTALSGPPKGIAVKSFSKNLDSTANLAIYTDTNVILGTYYFVVNVNGIDSEPVGLTVI